MNTLSKIENNGISLITEKKYDIVLQEKNIKNFENLVIAEFKRIVKEFLLFVDEKWSYYMELENKNEEDIYRCDKFRELKSFLSNEISRERKIIGMAENKSNVLTVEFKKDITLSISIKDIEGAMEVIKSIQKKEYKKESVGPDISAEFVTRVFSRTTDGDFKSVDFSTNFQIEFANFSVLSWERTLIHFVKARPEKSPSFNEILKVVEMYEYSNISLQDKINFLAIFKK
jgi:hypothetical protein